MCRICPYQTLYSSRDARQPHSQQPELSRCNPVFEQQFQAVLAAEAKRHRDRELGRQQEAIQHKEAGRLRIAQHPRCEQWVKIDPEMGIEQ
jgi:hypothetical protein